jgi:hypothetical protein
MSFCCICLDDSQQLNRKILQCCHGFHERCIDIWIQSHPLCPLCRTPVNDIGMTNRHQNFNLPNNEDQRLYIPLLFWHNRSDSHFIPLASLPFSGIVNIDISQVNDEDEN